MYRKLDKKVEEEAIVLFNLKNLPENRFDEYFNLFDLTCKKSEKEPNKSYEERKIEVRKDIKNMVNEFIIGKKETYYNINEQKSQEIDVIFKQIKLKINFDSYPKLLIDEIFYTFSEGNFAIYNGKFFNKSLYLKPEKEYKINSMILLDNKDLVFLAYGQLLIYRYQNGNYALIQIIQENRAGYELQYSHSGCILFPQAYEPKFIKAISGNRFICVNNYGYKIYSLNEKNEYSTILIEAYYEGIKMIHELDSNNFIFCTDKYCGDSYGGPAHNILIIGKIQLKNMEYNEKEDRLKKTENKDYYDGNHSNDWCLHNKPINITKEDAKRAIESLKFTANNQQIFELSQYGVFHYFRSYVVLKNKYFVVSIDDEIIIFDLMLCKQLKRYELLIELEDYLFKAVIDLKKWICKDDNEFFICTKGNIILFKLTDDIQLKIINQSYFPEIKNLKILSKEKNKFYDDGEEEKYSFGSQFSCYDEYNDEQGDTKICIAAIYE